MPFGFPEAPHFLAGDLGLSQLGKKTWNVRRQCGTICLLPTNLKASSLPRISLGVRQHRSFLSIMKERGKKSEENCSSVKYMIGGIFLLLGVWQKRRLVIWSLGGPKLEGSLFSSSAASDRNGETMLSGKKPYLPHDDEVQLTKGVHQY